EDPGSPDFGPCVSVEIHPVLLGAIAQPNQPEPAAIERDVAPNHEPVPGTGAEVVGHDVVGSHHVSALAGDQSSARPGRRDVYPAEYGKEDEDGATQNANSHTSSIV